MTIFAVVFFNAPSANNPESEVTVQGMAGPFKSYEEALTFAESAMTADFYSVNELLSPGDYDYFIDNPHVQK
jgi:hypothetical protein